METIDPSVISEAGGVNLTITGRYFLDNPGTLVAFGSNATLSPAEVNDSKVCSHYTRQHKRRINECPLDCGCCSCWRGRKERGREGFVLWQDLRSQLPHHWLHE
jgi:hypothetical protein